MDSDRLCIISSGLNNNPKCLICQQFQVKAFSAPGTQERGQTKKTSDIHLKPLDKGVWLHTTYHALSGYGRVPGNGLLVVHGTSAVLIDLPWTNEQTALLFDWVKKELKANIESVSPAASIWWNTPWSCKLPAKREKRKGDRTKTVGQRKESLLKKLRKTFG